MAPTETLFTKIINREIPADIVYEDELCLAFRDINPQAPVHVLLIPKTPIAKLSESSDSDQALLGHLLRTAPKIAEQQGYQEYISTGGEQWRRSGTNSFSSAFTYFSGPQLYMAARLTQSVTLFR